MTTVHHIPFTQVPQLSARDVAYTTADARMRPFYKYPVTLEAFADVIADKQREPIDRATLVQALKAQYADFDANTLTNSQIDSLGLGHTFTVVTAHQPCLFTGPLYYVTKICTAINLANRLRQAYPDNHFVPVFIIGGEDHDFEEVNHLHLFGKTVRWDNTEKGPVGMMSTDTLTDALAEVKTLLGDSEAAHAAAEQLERAFTSHALYGKAMQAYLHDLFADFGLLVLDMNDRALKQLFVPIMRQELLEHPSQQFIEAAQTALTAAGFSGQAHAREVNLFYMQPGLRERILLEGDLYKVNNTDLTFTRPEIEAELANHPERFSPNVIMRPLYEEVVLPNLAYIGGGGELAYWLERKAQFEHFGVNFPMLIRRNSLLWIDAGNHKRMEKLGLTDIADLFHDTDALIRQFVSAHTDNELTIADEKAQLEQLFLSIAQKAQSIDPTLAKAIEAEYTRQAKAVEQLEGRLLRAEKQKHETAINQLRTLKEKLFPGNGLQERHDNFLPLYVRHGRTLFEELIRELDPLREGFVVIQEE